MPHPQPWIGFEDLVDLVRTRNVVVLSGAGVSTESGIPDYRGPDTQHKDRSPIRYQAFVQEEAARRHYWARSTIGWPQFKRARPNAGHRALARLEAAGMVSGIVTQNVDRLHQEAGSQSVVELHGALADVICLSCGRITARETLQERLLALNPGWTDRAGALAPDGDADLPRSVTQDFRIANCRTCGGILKPKVIFFGENTKPAPVGDAWTLVESADALLVTGSSLAVYSGYRFVRTASETNQDVAIINIGPTRGDDLARIRVDGKTGEVLPELADAVSAPPPSSPASKLPSRSGTPRSSSDDDQSS